MSMQTMPPISEQDKQQYHEEGYFILERVIPDEHLQMLREECQMFIDKVDAEMDARGQRVEGITHKDKRYFISNRYRESQRMRDFIFSPLMAEICRATLGSDAYLFNEQWVVKGAEQGMKFAWHQDSGYVGYLHRPYLTCWCTLDDVNEENGTVYILPHSRAGTRQKIFDHVVEQGTNDKIGYHGDDPGIPLIVPAGSIACFSSYTFHRSGANTTPNLRRIYLPQYAREPIVTPNGQLRNFAIPFLRDGEVVYDAEHDVVDT